MQKPSIEQKKASVSEMLNQQIRHLLFLNPLLDIFVIKRQLAMLSSQLRNDKLETIRYLTLQREDFVKNTTSNYLETIKEHIHNWEKEIAPVTFDDVLELIEGQSMTIMDVAPHRVTPRHIERWLSAFLIGQPEYARKLSFCFYLHSIRQNNEDLPLPRPTSLSTVLQE